MSEQMFYVAEDPDQPGAAFASCVDRPEYAKSTAKDIADWLRRGGIIHRVNGETSMKMLSAWTTQPLSPTAKAVLDASNCAGSRIVQLHIAAAIRALVEQTLPDLPHPHAPDPTLFGARIDLGGWIERQHLRSACLSVAHELEEKE